MTYIAYRYYPGPERTDHWPRCSSCHQYLDRIGDGIVAHGGGYKCPETPCEKYGQIR